MSFSDLFNLNTYDGDMFIYGEDKDSIYGIKNECLEPNMDIVIPDGTKTLSFSFVQKINAKSIYIPSSVERIGLLLIITINFMAHMILMLLLIKRL